MALYPGIPTIRTSTIDVDGKSMTQVWKDGRIIRVVPTDKSQIRAERSYLWVKSEESVKASFFGKTTVK